MISTRRYFDLLRNSFDFERTSFRKKIDCVSYFLLEIKTSVEIKGFAALEINGFPSEINEPPSESNDFHLEFIEFPLEIEEIALETTGFPSNTNDC